MTDWTTAVLGVTPNSSRYAYKAVEKLTENGFKTVALGFRPGEVSGIPILTTWPEHIENLKVVSLYIGSARQPEFYEYILGLRPQKVIFNPGTENIEFYKQLSLAGIKFEEACTLVLISTGAYSEIIE